MHVVRQNIYVDFFYNWRENESNIICEKNDFIFLSRAETEFKNSPMGVDNFLKGCKW